MKFQALQRAVKVEAGRCQNSHAPWFHRHLKLIQRIQDRVFGSEPFRFGTLEQFAIPKLGSENEYRAVTKTGPIEAIVSSLVARWLRAQLDGDWSPCSYAFRAQKNKNHHAAFASLADFQKAFGGELWLAETDIRGFYDTLSHRQIRAMLRLIQKRAYAKGAPLDYRGVAVILAMLGAYDFQKSVLDHSDTLIEGNPNGRFMWPEKELKALHKEYYAETRFGVPQGLALSCVIANIVLDYADSRVEAVMRGSSKPIHYGRYCDDMIIASPDYAKSAEAWNECNAALRRLGLPAHEAREDTCDGKKTKSCAPYLHCSVVR